MVTPAVQREAVAHLQACHGMSERRACRVTGADRKSMRYRSQRGDDTEVREKLRELAQNAAPGPWYTSAPSEHAVWYDIKDGRYLIADTSSGFTDDGNAEYIAAANPATVLALLARGQAVVIEYATISA